VVSVAEWRERFAQRRAEEAAERERLRRLRAQGSRRRRKRRTNLTDIEEYARIEIDRIGRSRATPSDRLAAARRLLSRLMDIEQDLRAEVRARCQH
jgi:uncharacterized protein involved in exopolysaccharide biosynthesis